MVGQRYASVAGSVSGGVFCGELSQPSPGPGGAGDAGYAGVLEMAQDFGGGGKMQGEMLVLSQHCPQPGLVERYLLPLRQRDRKTMPPTRPAEWVLRKRAFRNGTDSRNLLPLWQRGRRAMPPTRPAEWVQWERAFRNGTESREILPLWKNEYVRTAGKE